jgi:hypothetical protein
MARLDQSHGFILVSGFNSIAAKYQQNRKPENDKRRGDKDPKTFRKASHSLPSYS